MTPHHLRRLAREEPRGRGERSREEGIEAEVVDLRSLRPLDTATILASVAKTHRAVIVDEGWRTGSLAGEVSAQIMEQGFDLLDWPVRARLQRRGADAVREAPRGRGAAAAPSASSPRCREMAI